MLENFNISEITFEYPSLIALGLLGVLFVLFEYFPGRKYFYSLQSLKNFIDKHLIKHLIQGNETKKKSWFRAVIIFLITLMLAFAFANPRWDFQDIETFKPAVNVIFLVDVSKSMNAKDEKPNRLERAKQEIADLVKKSKGINFGLMVFANQAHIVSPVTEDKAALLYFLPSISTDLVSVQGSNIIAGLTSADIMLKTIGSEINYIIVMSDGGFENKDKLKSFANKIKNAKIISFGFGSVEGSPIPDEQGKFITQDSKTVISKLEKENLIALSGLDNYIQASFLSDDTDKIENIITSQLNAKLEKTKLVKIWHDRFYIPLIIIILLLIPFFRKGVIFPVILILLMPQISIAQEAENTKEDTIKVVTPNMLERIESTLFKNKDQRAEDYFNQRDYEKAKENFSSNYNKAVSLYRSGDIQNAEKFFQLDATNNLEAKYNLANTQLKQMKLDDAINNYEKVLKKKPNHENAKANLEIAKRLKQHQQQQNKNQKQNQRDNNQQKEKQQNQKEQVDQSDSKKQNKDQKNEQNNTNNQQDNQSNQDNDRNREEKELDIQAKNIFVKISNNPAEFMARRFKYEEQKNSDKKNNTKIKPW
jgi:Ca-activated chloride channel family protein